MCWLYAPGSVDSNSESISHGRISGPSATSNMTVTPCGSCGSGSTLATSTTLPYGTTSGPSMGHLGVDAWISSLRATRASLSPPPGSDSDTRTNAGFGMTSGGSFATWSRDTSSWKTSQLTFPGLGDESSVTWPRAGGVSNGTAYLRLPSAPRTSAIAYSLSLHGAWLISLLPTPSRGHGSNKSPSAGATRRPGLAMLASSGLLPTPCPERRQALGQRGVLDRERTARGRTLTDCTVGPTRAQRRNGPTLTDCVDGPVGTRQKRRLNPAYVEWMLGLPVGWTD
jgi:hypothetical protein